MTVTIIKGSEITRPDTTPLGSSILDHATVATVKSFGLRNNEGLWNSYNCLDTLVPTPICPDPTAAKTFGFSEWMPGFEFAVHGGVQCGAVGLDVEDQKAEVARVFELNEGKGIEQALLLNRFVATDSDAPVQWEAPVDVTVTGPTGLLSLSANLAALIGYAAQHYAGQPTIHMPRAAAELLGDRIIWKDGLAYTRTGAKIATGGGYDGSNADGSWDLFATGEVYVEKSDLIRQQSYVIPGDGSGVGSDENGLADNTVVTLVERMYRVGIDCFVAKATAEVW